MDFSWHFGAGRMFPLHSVAARRTGEHETDLIYTLTACRIMPVSLLVTLRLPSPHPDGQALGRVLLSGAFSFQDLHFDLRSRVVFIQPVIDMLLFHLSVVLVDQSLHGIQYH